MNRKPHIVISRPISEAGSNSQTLAEARFDIHGTGTSISYPLHNQGTRNQRLELSSSRLQVLSLTIGGHPYWWRPFPGNKDVWELSNEYEEVIARFVHSPSSPSSSPPSTSPILASQSQFGPEEASQPQSQEQQALPSSPQPNSVSRNNSVFSISSNTSTEGTITKTKATKTKEPTKLGQLHVVSALVGNDSERDEIICSAIVVVERMRRRRGFLEGQNGRYGGRGVGRNGVAYIPQ